MQPDNESRQSITPMASTMMPVRFLTNFRLLELSIRLRSHDYDVCETPCVCLRAAASSQFFVAAGSASIAVCS